MHTTTGMRYMCVWQHYRSFYINTGNLYKGHNIFVYSLVIAVGLLIICQDALEISLALELSYCSG